MPTTRCRAKQLLTESLSAPEFKIQKKQSSACDYEERRLQNIADNKAMLAKIMGDLQSWKPSQSKINKRRSSNSTAMSPRKRSQRNFPDTVSVRRRNPGRAARPESLVDETSRPHTPDSGFDSPSRFWVKFGFRRSSGGEEDDDDCMTVYDSDSDSDDEHHHLWQPEPEERQQATQRFYKELDEITEEDLAAVSDRTSDKVYHSVLGSTCHQCRQKTIDTKTICRNQECAGVRGQFCGPCLKNRYGEDARLCLKDEKWICPPCRGICNCSFCRRKAGRCATGILIHLARDNGYSDVASYLSSFGKKD